MMVERTIDKRAVKIDIGMVWFIFIHNDDDDDVAEGLKPQFFFFFLNREVYELVSNRHRMGIYHLGLLEYIMRSLSLSLSRSLCNTLSLSMNVLFFYISIEILSPDSFHIKNTSHNHNQSLYYTPCDREAIHFLLNWFFASQQLHNTNQLGD